VSKGGGGQRHEVRGTSGGEKPEVTKKTTGGFGQIPATTGPVKNGVETKKKKQLTKKTREESGSFLVNLTVHHELRHPFWGEKIAIKKKLNTHSGQKRGGEGGKSPGGKTKGVWTKGTRKFKKQVSREGGQEGKS